MHTHAKGISEQLFVMALNTRNLNLDVYLLIMKHIRFNDFLGVAVFIQNKYKQTHMFAI